MQKKGLSTSKELLAAMPNASRRSTNWKNKKANKLIIENHHVRENSSYRRSKFRDLGLLREEQDNRDSECHISWSLAMDRGQCLRGMWNNRSFTRKGSNWERDWICKKACIVGTVKVMKRERMEVKSQIGKSEVLK